MPIWKKHSTDESSSKRRSCCLHDQLDLRCGKLALRNTIEELQERQEIQCCYKAETAIKPQINTDIESFLLMFLFV